MDKEKEKEHERKQREELNELFKPVQVAQKIPFDTDPKLVLCQYFKTRTCEKGYGKQCIIQFHINYYLPSQSWHTIGESAIQS
ncbi:hypothetical protein MJO28_015092 [Puccinia striiformis f. sp. tritici]|uniref:Uncharacterized protein n=1 Tax=Puccinia striiformis f. sp. tritici TaxID=168172 RepID=A0ACC0DRS5_9BASI|nr:hypothetical protein MJO28_015092 [Puccinia striiformis f. sp. tritici]